jgi:phosphopantothenoylcysteine decarboxylase/phosphopantothenate--cysteine ligase
MDGGMFSSPAVQENLARLAARSVLVAGPAEGHLASGLAGPGRMLEPLELVGHIRAALGHAGRLAGKKLVVTAGGTQEPLDPVRVITNRSSGKQGYALAQAAIDMGADVSLVSTTASLPAPVGARLVPVQTALQMQEAVLAGLKGADGLIMAAAVADFRPKHIAPDKMKKRDGLPTIELEPTPDILKTIADMPSKRPKVVVGFAAESRDLLENAQEKLKSKSLDLIVANDISAEGSGFAGNTNAVTLIFAAGQREALPLMSKAEVASVVIERVAALLEA